MILFIKGKSYPNIPDPVWKSNCPLTLTANATPSNNNGKLAFAITGYEVFKMYLGEIWPTHISRSSGWRRFGVILVGWPLLERNDLHLTPYQPTWALKWLHCDQLKHHRPVLYHLFPLLHTHAEKQIRLMQWDSPHILHLRQLERKSIYNMYSLKLDCKILIMFIHDDESDVSR